MEIEKVIEIDGLCKSFGEVKAVQGVGFCVKKGQLFAYLGVNGAGKSTTISIICGQLKKDAGSVFICGEDVEKNTTGVLGKIGVVFQTSALDRVLSVKDNLTYRAALYGITGEALERRLNELDALLDIKPLYKRTVGKLSGGQRRRIDIARALIHSPEILILDEPTTGLDPQTRKMLWDAVTTMRRERGMTVLLTTHYMEEAAESDYVVILDDGMIAAEGTPVELKNKYTGDFIAFYDLDEEKVKSFGMPYERIPGGYRMQVENTKAATELVIKYPELFSDYEITKGRMDDVFLNVTGKKLTGGAQ